ncbi:MAG: DUF2505 family protein [Sandaracinaceae bacterium]|nr:DUF2505 family protein [Sandaracinaceae bacterium]
MRFRIEHLIEAPLARVESAVLAPGALIELARRAPLIAEARELARREEGTAVERVGYLCAKAKLPMASRVIEGGQLAWNERIVFDRATHRARFTIEPALRPEWRSRFVCEGSYVLTETSKGTLRTIEGDLAIRAPIVGPAIERAVIHRIADVFEAEAEILRERCRG